MSGGAKKRLGEIRSAAGDAARHAGKENDIVNDVDFGVLLVGESARSFTHIIQRLERHGCRCRFVDSYEQARELIANESFELILSVIPPRANAISSLAERLVGTSASIYYAQLVEDGCWWLPALCQGERCFGAPALRPSEFAGVLDREVERFRAGAEIQPRRPMAPVIPLLTLPGGPKSDEIEAGEIRLRVRSKVAR
jgi:hypothetical protein